MGNVSIIEKRGQDGVRSVSNPPLVSVGMPAFNAERHIEEAIDSILNQSLSDLELIIFDNASTDGTADRCREAAARDPRVRYFRNEHNLGSPANYNLTLHEARGRYFKWGSSNDICHPEFLRKCVNALEADHTAVMACPRTRLFIDDPAAGEPYPETFNVDAVQPWTRFIKYVDGVGLNNLMNGVCRTEVLRKVPPIMPYFGSDQVTTAAMTLHGRVIIVPDEYFYRRMDANSSARLAGAEALRRHYDPSGRRRLLFPTWRLYFEYIKAVNSSPLSVPRRALLTGMPFRRMIWGRNKLLRDAAASFRQLATRKPGQLTR